MRFDPSRPLDDTVRSTVRALLRSGVEVLADDDVDPEFAVHEARKRCKESRALLRLVVDVGAGPGRRLDRSIRAAGRSLAGVRDAHVARELAGDASAGGEPPTADEVTAAKRESTDHLERAIERLDAVRFPSKVSALRSGLRRTTRRNRRAYERARRSPTPDHLHRWRTWNKRLWYQVRALEGASPSTLPALDALLDEIGETLGRHHDLSVVGAGTDEGRAELDRLGKTALRWGATVQVEHDRDLADRIVALWVLAAEDGPEPPLDGGSTGELE